MRKDRLDIVLDMDGVLSDFEFAFCMAFGDNGRTLESLVERYPHREKDILLFVGSIDTYKQLTPIPVGVQIAKWCGETHNGIPRANIEVVTSRPYKTAHVSEYWLRKFKIPHHKFTVDPNKSQYLVRIQPDILVDDIIGVCEYVYNRTSGVTPVLMKQPWNETPFFPRISTLSQFQSIYRRVADEKLLSDIEGAWLAPHLSGVR